MTETERKRASLFGDDETPPAEETKRALNLDRFTPQKAPELDVQVADSIGAESGFTTKHAPQPQQEQKPAKRDGRTLKKSARISQFNVRLKPQNAERFWAGAETEDMKYADDFLEHLLDLYEGRGLA